MMRYLSRLNALTRTPGYTRFQYASNFHFGNEETSVPFDACLYPVAENLVLNGNVGIVDSEVTFKFLRRCAKTYERVWWIPGPLELSHPTECMSVQFDKMQELVDAIDGTVYIGSKSNLVLPQTDLQIIATTGWGAPSDLDTTVRWFDSEDGKPKLINQDDLDTLSDDEHTWITRKLGERPKYKKLVFTHHDLDNKFLVRNGKSIEATLFGNRTTMSGTAKKGTPWIGCNPFVVNGARSSSYIPFAFYETKSEQRPPRGGGSSPSGHVNQMSLVPSY